MELSALISRQQARKSWWFYLRKRAYLRGQGWVIRDRSLKALVRASADQFSGEIKLQEVKEAAAAAKRAEDDFGLDQLNRISCWSVRLSKLYG